MIKNKDELYKSKEFSRLLALNGFIKVPFHTCVYYGLTPTEGILLGYIRNETKVNPQNAMTDSDTTLQVICNSSRMSIYRALKNLCNKGLIEPCKVTRNGQEFVGYRCLREIQQRIQIQG